MVQLGDEAPLGLEFVVEVDAPEDVAHEDRRAGALVTVRASPAGTAAGPSAAAEVLIMDRSLSMAGHGKLDEAKVAMCAAVDTLRDGTYLGIVAGHHRAEVIFPPDGVPVRVDAAAREHAKACVAVQLAEGGTAIGEWLACADRLFSAVPSPGVVRHAVLYTDGKDEHETPEELDTVLRACTDRFVCDARGLGEDWNFLELLRITQALHGGAEAVVNLSDLTGDFVRLMREAQRVVVARAYLGLRLNSRFRLDFVRQTLPVQADLTTRQEQGDEIHVPLGSWSPDTVRQYQVSLCYDPESLAVDEKLRAARITLHAEGADGTRRPCSETRNMVLRRRASPGLEFPRSPNLTRVENELELGMAMRACADAQQRGDFTRADRELRIATGLAEDLRDGARLELLRSVSETGPDGRLRVRRDASRGQMQRLGLDSVKSAAPPAAMMQPPPGDGVLPRVCPQCGTTSVGTARFCERCGHRFGDRPAADTGVDAGAGAARADGARRPYEAGDAPEDAQGDAPGDVPRDVLEDVPEDTPRDVQGDAL